MNLSLAKLKGGYLFTLQCYNLHLGHITFWKPLVLNVYHLYIWLNKGKTVLTRPVLQWQWRCPDVTDVSFVMLLFFFAHFSFPHWTPPFMWKLLITNVVTDASCVVLLIWVLPTESSMYYKRPSKHKQPGVTAISWTLCCKLTMISSQAGGKSPYWLGDTPRS